MRDVLQNQTSGKEYAVQLEGRDYSALTQSLQDTPSRRSAHGARIDSEFANSSLTDVEYELQAPLYYGLNHSFPSRMLLGSVDIGGNMTIYRELIQPYNYSQVSTSLITFLAPFKTDAKSEYVDVRVLNPDGADVKTRLKLYYSEKCPKIGDYGSGLNCRPCPTGGICAPVNLSYRSYYS